MICSLIIVCTGIISVGAQSDADYLSDGCQPGFYLDREIEGVEICTSCFDLCQLEPLLAFTKYHKCSTVLDCINWIQNKCPRKEIYDPILENCDACSVGCNTENLRIRGALCSIICNDNIEGTPATVLIPFKPTPSLSNPSLDPVSSDQNRVVDLDILIGVIVGIGLCVLVFILTVYFICKYRKRPQQCTDRDAELPRRQSSSVYNQSLYNSRFYVGLEPISVNNLASTSFIENTSEKSSLLPLPSFSSQHTNGSFNTDSETMVLINPDPMTTITPYKPPKLVPLDTRTYIPTESDYERIIGARQYDLIKSKSVDAYRYTISQERMSVTRDDPNETIHQPQTGSTGYKDTLISYENREPGDFRSQPHSSNGMQRIDQSESNHQAENVMETVNQLDNHDSLESSHNFYSYGSLHTSNHHRNNSEKSSVASVYDFKETHEMSGNFGEPIDEVPPDERPHIKNEKEHSQKTAQDIAGLPANLDMIPDVKTVLQKLAMLQWVKRLVSNGRFIRVWYDAIDEVNARRIIAEISGLSTRQFDCVHVRNAR